MLEELTTVPKKRNRRTCIALEDKIKILDKLRAGSRVVTLSKEFNMQESTIRSIRQNEDKIRAVVSKYPSNCYSTRINNTLFPKMEETLIVWIKDCNSKNIPLSSVVIRQKAFEIFQGIRDTESVSASEFDKIEFKASKGWFDRFKKRVSLQNVKIVGESTSAEAEDDNQSCLLDIKQEEPC